jgi:hypothetical protein
VRLIRGLELSPEALRSFAQLLLFPRQPLELAFLLFRRDLRLRQLTLAAAQVLLPSRQIANPVESAVLFLMVGTLFDLQRVRSRPLLALQLLVEERGQSCP